MLVTYFSYFPVIFKDGEYACYVLLSGIKQGLPLSPLLFFFYINDIFDYFYAIYGSHGLLEKIHVLIHADDSTLLASTRERILCKLNSLMHYCRINHLVLQPTKCKFIVINGEEHDKCSLKVNSMTVENTEAVIILGSPLNQSGNIRDDISSHVSKRFPSCIKFYNFVRSNKLAQIAIKLKVLESCVMSSLLYNCETFGNCIPRNLEALYIKLIRSALSIRSNIPNDIIFVETGLKSLKALIYARQLQFYRRFRQNLSTGSNRLALFNGLLEAKLPFLIHYQKLDVKYNSKDDVFNEFIAAAKENIRGKALNRRYKYHIYHKLNPTLEKSPFIDTHHQLHSSITRFRLGSHNLPIETGRWLRIPRDDRLCKSCNILGDEHHFIYSCIEIDRTNLNLPPDISLIWKHDCLYELFKRLITTEHLS